MIGAYLLGLSEFARGSYSPTEIALTILMAVFASVGAWQCVRAGRLSGGASAVAFVGFAALQLAAMIISFMRPFANR